MLEEIHEALGLAAASCAVATIALGGAAYRYGWLKGIVPLSRPRVVNTHLLAAGIFALLVLGHHLTTDKEQVILTVATIAIAATLLLGFSFRLSRTRFKTIIRIKVVLVLLAALALPVGHERLEGNHEDEEYRHGRLSPFRSSSFPQQDLVAARNVPPWPASRAQAVGTGGRSDPPVRLC